MEYDQQLMNIEEKINESNRRIQDITDIVLNVAEKNNPERISNFISEFKIQTEEKQNFIYSKINEIENVLQELGSRLSKMTDMAPNEFLKEVKSSTNTVDLSVNAIMSSLSLLDQKYKNFQGKVDQLATFGELQNLKSGISTQVKDSIVQDLSTVKNDIVNSLNNNYNFVEIKEMISRISEADDIDIIKSKLNDLIEKFNNENIVGAKNEILHSIQNHPAINEIKEKLYNFATFREINEIKEQIGRDMNLDDVKENIAQLATTQSINDLKVLLHQLLHENPNYQELKNQINSLANTDDVNELKEKVSTLLEKTNNDTLFHVKDEILFTITNNSSLSEIKMKLEELSRSDDFNEIKGKLQSILESNAIGELKDLINSYEFSKQFDEINNRLAFVIDKDDNAAIYQIKDEIINFMNNLTNLDEISDKLNTLDEIKNQISGLNSSEQLNEIKESVFQLINFHSLDEIKGDSVFNTLDEIKNQISQLNNTRVLDEIEEKLLELTTFTTQGSQRESFIAHNIEEIKEKLNSLGSNNELTELKDGILNITNNISVLTEIKQLIENSHSSEIFAEKLCQVKKELLSNFDNNYNFIELKEKLNELSSTDDLNIIKEQLNTLINKNFTEDWLNIKNILLENLSNIPDLSGSINSLSDKFDDFETILRENINIGPILSEIRTLSNLNDLTEIKEKINILFDKSNKSEITDLTQFKKDVLSAVDNSTQLFEIKDAIEQLATSSNTEEIKNGLNEILSRDFDFNNLKSELIGSIDNNYNFSEIKDKLENIYQEINNFKLNIVNTGAENPEIQLNSDFSSIINNLNSASDNILSGHSQIFEKFNDINQKLSTTNSLIEQFSSKEEAINILSETEKLNSKIDTLIENPVQVEISSLLDEIHNIQDKMTILLNTEPSDDIKEDLQNLQETLTIRILGIFESISFSEEAEDLKNFTEEQLAKLSEEIKSIKEELSSASNAMSFDATTYETIANNHDEIKDILSTFSKNNAENIEENFKILYDGLKTINTKINEKSDKTNQNIEKSKNEIQTLKLTIRELNENLNQSLSQKIDKLDKLFTRLSKESNNSELVESISIIDEKIEEVNSNLSLIWPEQQMIKNELETIVNNVKNLQQSFIELQDGDNADIKDKADAILQEINNIRSYLGNFSTTINSFSIASDNAASKLQGLAENSDLFNSIVDRFSNISETITTRTDKVELGVDLANHNLETLSEAQNELKAYIQGILDNINGLSKGLSTISSGSTGKIEDMADQFSSIRSDIQSFVDRYRDIDSKTNKLIIKSESQNEMLESSLNSFQETINELKSSVANKKLVKDIGHINQVVSVLDKKVDSISSSAIKTNESTHILKEALMQIGEWIDGASGVLEDTNSGIEELNSSTNYIKSETQSIQQAITSLGDEIRENSNSQNSYNEIKNQITDELNTINEKYESLNSKLWQIEEKINSFSNIEKMLENIASRLSSEDENSDKLSRIEEKLNKFEANIAKIANLVDD